MVNWTGITEWVSLHLETVRRYESDWEGKYQSQGKHGPLYQLVAKDIVAAIAKEVEQAELVKPDHAGTLSR